MNRLTIGCALTLIAMPSIWLAYRWYTRYDRAYARLVPGTTKAEVLRQFGKPDYITSCREYPSWDDKLLDKKSAKCVQEFVYGYRIRIGAWVIGFDSNGRAVTKGYESSP